MGYLVYFSIVRAKLVVNSPYNQRQDAYAQSVIRGKLVDKNGNTLAETVVDEDGNRKFSQGRAGVCRRSDRMYGVDRRDALEYLTNTRQLA